MIEVAGFRYACGPRSARSARWLMKVVEVGYALGILHAVLRLGQWPRDVVESASCLVMTILPFAVLLAFGLHLTFSHADKQSVEQSSPHADARRIHRWWLSSPGAAWLRLTPIWLGAALFAVLIGMVFVARYLRGASYVVVVGVVIVLMLWHVHVSRQLVRRIGESAALGNGEPYWQFDFDRFDSTDEGRFRARFAGDRHWKFPGSITHPVEADRYADRARQQRFNNLAATAGSALVAMVFAQQILADVLRTTVHDITNILDAPHPPPGFLYLCSVQVALLLCLLPVSFQFRTNEMDSLAKLYEDRGALLTSE